MIEVNYSMAPNPPFDLLHIAVTRVWRATRYRQNVGMMNDSVEAAIAHEEALMSERMAYVDLSAARQLLKELEEGTFHA